MYICPFSSHKMSTSQTLGLLNFPLTMSSYCIFVWYMSGIFKRISPFLWFDLAHQYHAFTRPSISSGVIGKISDFSFSTSLSLKKNQISPSHIGHLLAPQKSFRRLTEVQKDQRKSTKRRQKKIGKKSDNEKIIWGEINVIDCYTTLNDRIAVARIKTKRIL